MDAKNFSERLKKLRLDNGMSLSDLAKAVGIAKQSVHSWESMKTAPSFANLATLASCLKVPVDYLLGGEKGVGGLRLRATRVSEGLTQAEAAKAVGIKESEWEKYESGEKAPSPMRLIKISEYFGVNKYFIAGKGNASRHGLLYMTFSKKLKHYRLKKGLTQKQAAEYLNVEENTFRDYEKESGKTELDIDTISKLSDMLGVTTDYLLGLSHDADENSVREGCYSTCDVFQEIPLYFILLLEQLDDAENRLKNALRKRIYQICCELFVTMENDTPVAIKNVESIFLDSLNNGTHDNGNTKLYDAIAQFARHEREHGDKKFCQKAAAVLSKAIGILLSENAEDGKDENFGTSRAAQA